jgi:hypothetical protein
MSPCARRRHRELYPPFQPCRKARRVGRTFSAIARRDPRVALPNKVAQSGSFSGRFVPLQRSRRPRTTRAQITVSVPIMLDIPRSNHYFLLWHKRKTYATPLKAHDFVIQRNRSGAIPVERSTQPNRQHHQDECRGRPVPDNCATAGRGRGEIAR